jgi:hypothetical protein
LRSIFDENQAELRVGAITKLYHKTTLKEPLSALFSGGNCRSNTRDFSTKLAATTKHKYHFRFRPCLPSPIKGKIDHEKVFTTTAICTAGKLSVGTEPVRRGQSHSRHQHQHGKHQAGALC